MLIEIPHIPTIRFCQLLSDNAFRDCLDNIALAHYEGKHITVGHPETLASIAEAKILSDKTKGIFRNIKSRYGDSMRLKRIIDDHITISIDSRNISTEPNGLKVRYNVPYQWFADSSKIQKSRLLCEDEDDSKIYLKISKAYLASNQEIKGIQIVLRPSGGGGNSISDRLLECHEDEGITICIVDSDRKCPGGGLGQTALQLRRTFSQLDTTRCIASIIILECHELENLLPSSLIEASLLPESDATIRERIHHASRLDILGQLAPRWFLDLKEGLKLFDMFTSSNTEYIRFIHGFVESVRSNCIYLNPACSDDAQCEQRDKCKCIVFRGFDEILLKMVLAHLEKSTPHKISEILFSSNSPNCKDYWRGLCSKLLSWGCAYKPLRA